MQFYSIPPPRKTEIEDKKVVGLWGEKHCAFPIKTYVSGMLTFDLYKPEVSIFFIFEKIKKN